MNNCILRKPPEEGGTALLTPRVCVTTAARLPLAALLRCPGGAAAVGAAAEDLGLRGWQLKQA